MLTERVDDQSGLGKDHGQELDRGDSHRHSGQVAAEDMALVLTDYLHL